MGTHLRVLSESFTMITKVRGFRWFQNFLLPWPLDESSLSIGSDNDHRGQMQPHNFDEIFQVET